MRRKILILSFLTLTFSIFAQENSLKTRTRSRWGKSEMHSTNHNHFAATIAACRAWITVSENHSDNRFRRYQTDNYQELS